jgi:hypothetical protein
MKFIKCLILLCFLSAKCFSQAFWPFDSIFKNLKQTSAQDISYQYKIVIEDIDEHVNIDSISGQLSFSKNRFVDSNNQFFMARNEVEYCRLEHDTRKAIILSLNSLQDKLKTSIAKEPVPLLSVTEDFLQTEGNKIVFDVTNTKVNRVVLSTTSELLHKAIFEFRKSDNKLIAAYFEIDDIDTDIDKTYRTKYSMHHFSYKVNEQIFDLSRIFKYTDGKVSLSGKYASYKITKLI